MNEEIEITEDKEVSDLPVLDKADFEEFRDFVSSRGTVYKSARCQTWKRHTGRTQQCKNPANRKAGKNICRFHGGTATQGKSTAQGELNRLASITKHGEMTVEKQEAQSRLAKVSIAANKVALLLGQKTPQYNKAYKQPKMSDLPELLQTLADIEL